MLVDLAGSLRNFHIVLYTDIAAAAILVWEYAITLEFEVSFVWCTAWNPMKLLFIFVRYLPFFDVPLVIFAQMRSSLSLDTCNTMFNLAGWCIVAGELTAEAIFTVRTWTIWNRSKRVGCFLLFIFATCSIAVCWIEVIYLKSVQYTPFADRMGIIGCSIDSASSIISTSFAILIASEACLLLMTCVQGVRYYRSSGGFMSRQVVYVLYRDGVAFYIYVLGLSIVNLIVIVQWPNGPGRFMTTFQRVMHSTLGGRVLINIHEARKLDATPIDVSGTNAALPDWEPGNVRHNGFGDENH